LRNVPRLVVVCLAGFAACGDPSAVFPVAATAPVVSPSPPPVARDPVVAAVGDIVCGAGSRGNPCRRRAHPRRLQYETGSYPDFINFYELTWGPLGPVTHPVPGNHEYMTP
jgi:hypothetical protein